MRMYFFTMYNLSGIQKGIQAGHAAMRYALRYGLTNMRVSEQDDEAFVDLLNFASDHETFIILDGGTSSTMLDRMDELSSLGIPFAEFREPDLNHSVSAIAFIVNEDDYAPSENVIIYKTNPVYEYLQRFRLASN